MTKVIPYIIAAFIGLSIGSGAYWAMINKGVRIEQVRVENQGKKINAQVEKRQRASAAQPANRVLDKWSTD